MLKYLQMRSPVSTSFKILVTAFLAVLPLAGWPDSGVNKTEMQYYLNRSNTLGYEAGVTFEVPSELQPAVNFWKKIYTQYNTKQAVIHDSRYLQVVYTVVDFSNIEDNPQLSDPQKRRIREDKSEEIKKRYRDILARLDRVDMEEISPEALDDEERRIYHLFTGINESYRFENAMNRLRSQVGQRNEFIRGIVDSGGFIQEMEEIFRSYQLPTQLVRLSFVESMFNTKALSKAHASGIWQFIPTTGRSYLRIDHVIDERNDPILATHAAARLLRQNFESLEAWPLAVTAYNHGRSGMVRAVKSVGSRHLPDIITHYRSESFGFASRNFYAQFLAAVEVEKHYPKYFGPLVRMRPVRYEILRLPDHVALQTLSEYCRIPEDELIDLNPALNSNVINSNSYVPTDYDLKIPRGRKDDFLLAYANIPDEYRHSLQQAVHWHRVRRGEALSTIARQYGVGTGHLLQTNGLSSGNKIYVGQLLRVPEKATMLAKASARRPDNYVDMARAPKATVTYPTVKVLPLENVEEEEEGAAAPEPPGALASQQVVAEPPKEAPAPPPEIRTASSSATETIVAGLLDSGAGLAGAGAEGQTDAGHPAVLSEDDSPGFAALFSLLDPENKEKAISLAPNVTPPAEIGWNFQYKAANVQSSSDAPFAGSTVVTDGETPGHFAEWCRISTPQFRRLNQIKFGQGVTMGQKVKLECLVTLEDFQNEREAFHRALQQDYLKECPSVDVRSHRVRSSESIWDLATKVYDTPIWLIQKYNPSKDLTRKVPAGVVLQIPKCVKMA